MVQTKLVVDNESYIMVKNKQNELINKAGKYIPMESITNFALKSIIPYIHLEADKDGWLLRVESIYKETNDISKWNPSEIEIISGSGGYMMSIDEVLTWINEHGYKILGNDDYIHIKMGDIFSSDDGGGEIDIPISYILENKVDFQEFKDIMEVVNSNQKSMVNYDR